MNINFSECLKRYNYRFSFYNSRTIYKNVLIPRKPEEEEIPMLQVPKLNNLNFTKGFCFYDLFNYLDYRVVEKETGLVDRLIVSVLVFRDYKALYNNCTWATINQLNTHIDYLKTSLGFDFYYTIKEIKLEEIDRDAFEIILDTKRLSKIKIKFLLCWIRYMYEFPSTLAMFDAYMLKEQVFPDEELYNLFLLPAHYINSVDIASHKIHSDQCISVYGTPKTKELLLQRLSNFPSSSLNSLFYPDTNTYYGECYSNLFKKVGSKELKICDWINPESFEQRIPDYIKIKSLLDTYKRTDNIAQV